MPLARLRDRYGLLATLAAGYSLLALLSTDRAELLLDQLSLALGGNGFPWVVLHHWRDVGSLALTAATIMAVAVFVARMIARASLRATGADPRARLQRWIEERPRTVRALLAAPAALTLNLDLVGRVLEAAVTRPVAAAVWLVAGIAAPALGVWLLARSLLRGMLAPLVHEGEAERSADGFSFSAVAVTREARAAVALLAVATLAVLAALVFMPTTAGDPRVPPALLAYTVLAATAAAAFRRASRVALGLDGVRIGGTSRTRFFAYRDLDAVEATFAGDILLRRHGRVVLRLQLHGEDASLREAIVARLRDAIAVAGTPGGGAAHRLAESASPALLAQAARGDGNYRAPGATREELWEVVEKPSANGKARTLAANALARGGDREDRARLRIAAERCADPETREALEKLAASEAQAEEEANPLRPAAQTARIG
jgi:hypothetical protein